MGVHLIAHFDNFQQSLPLYRPVFGLNFFILNSLISGKKTTIANWLNPNFRGKIVRILTVLLVRGTVSVPIMDELKKYVSRLDSKQEKLFANGFKQYRWNQIRKKLGLGDFKFHDLRKTFGSVLAQNVVSTAIIQRLLEHSSSDLTNKVYMNVDPVLHQAVDLMPADDWLKD